MTEHSRPTRRDVLGTAAAAAAAGLAGCTGEPAPDPRYRLRASPIPEGLAEHLRWEPRGRFTDQYEALMVRAVEDGELVTEGFALYPSGHERPRYVEHQGGYYRIGLAEDGSVQRERWTFWFDLIEGEPPADADIYDSSLGRGGGEDLAATYGLDERDVAVVEDAAGEIPTEFGYRDPEDAPPARRGHVFLHREPEETALLPEPPFTHVRFGEGDDARYARAVAERATVELTRYRHTAERVATDREGYVAHLEEEHLAADIAPTDLSDAERSVVEQVVGGGRSGDRTPEVQRESRNGSEGPPARGETGGEYEEAAPPASEGLASVLDRVGIEPPETPDPGRVTFADEVLVRYDGALYELQLEVRG